MDDFTVDTVSDVFVVLCDHSLLLTSCSEVSNSQTLENNKMRKGRGEEGGGGVHDEKSREGVKERERKKSCLRSREKREGCRLPREEGMYSYRGPYVGLGDAFQATPTCRSYRCWCFSGPPLHSEDVRQLNKS